MLRPYDPCCGGRSTLRPYGLVVDWAQYGAPLHTVLVGGGRSTLRPYGLVGGGRSTLRPYGLVVDWAQHVAPLHPNP